MFRSTWIPTRFFRAENHSQKGKASHGGHRGRGGGFTFEWSNRVLLMDDRPNRCRPVASQLFVLQKCELHSPATKKVPRLERVRKSEAAPRNRNAAGGSIRPRALQARFTMVNDRKHIIRVLGDDPKNISGMKLA
jgi:hypothetical protein